MTRKLPEALVEEFAFHVAASTEALLKTDRPNAKSINRHADKATAAFSKLRSLYGNEGRDALARLFEHPRPDVRAEAAAFLLRYKTKEATRVLKEVAKGKGFVAFEAREALKRWKEGAWELDPAD